MAIGIIKPSNYVIEILSAPVTLTDEFATISAPIQCKKTDGLVFWLDITMNDSENVEFRPLALPAPDSDSLYNFPTEEIWTGINKIYPKVYEIQKEESQKLLFQVTTGQAIPYIVIQIRAGIVGANPCVLNSLMVSTIGDQL